MPKILRDDKQQQCLDKDGYAVFNFFDSETVDKLRTLYETRLRDNLDQGFEVVQNRSDKSLVKEVSDILIAAFGENASTLFSDIRIFSATYLNKHPNKEAIIPPHQDWTFTDETKYASYLVWIPLQDTKLENGTLCLIPGSHKLFDYPRSSPSPQSRSFCSNHVSTLFPYVQPIDLKAGQALVYDNRIVHASTSNASDASRLVVAIGITYKEAPLWHFYESPKSPETLHHYEVDEDFFLDYDNNEIRKIYNTGGLLSNCKELGTTLKMQVNASSVEVESRVRSIKGNTWRQEVLDAIAPNTSSTQAPEVVNKPAVGAVTKEIPVAKPEPDKPAEPVSQEWKDERTFFEKYTIPNIIAEIRWRLTGKA